MANPITKRRARFHELEVAAVRPLTADSMEVTFAVPPDLQDEYDYLPGQYVALRAHVDGHEGRRSYSICSPPTAGEISVGIKRDLGGLFSVWAHENLKAGDRLDVVPHPQHRHSRQLGEDLLSALARLSNRGPMDTAGLQERGEQVARGVQHTLQGHVVLERGPQHAVHPAGRGVPAGELRRGGALARACQRVQQHDPVGVERAV